MIDEIRLVKTSTGKSLLLNKDPSTAYILDAVDWGTVQGSHHTYKYLNQIGVSEMNTSLETRSVSILGYIVAIDAIDMSSKKLLLGDFVDPQVPVDIVYNNFRLTFSPDSTVKFGKQYSENNEIICKFLIAGTAHNPLFTDKSENRLNFAVTQPRFHFPLIMSEYSPEKGVVFGLRSENLIATVMNIGSKPTGMRVIFKAKGAVVNPKLINITTQEFLFINKAMVADEEIEIVTEVGKKKVVGKIGNQPFVNYYPYKSLDSSWLQLSVGKNSFRYDAESGLNNLDIVVYFTNKYLEVEECY